MNKTMHHITKADDRIKEVVDRSDKETNWNSGRILVEPSQKKRTCHKCGTKIPKGTFSVKVKMSSDRYSNCNNLCQGCLVEATAIVKFLNNEGEDYRRVYA